MTSSDDPFDNLAYRFIRHPINQLSAEERAAIEVYTAGGFQDLNAALSGHRPMTDSLRQRADTIRAALRRFPLEASLRVTREIGASDIDLPTADAAPSVIGRLFDNRGFLSTSMSQTPPHSTLHIDPIELDLYVPSGTPALAVGGLSEYPLERELLVTDARRIHIVESRMNPTSRRWRVYGRVLPEGELA